MTTDKKARKEMPIDRGVLQYFPDAIAAVANVSYVGNQQHNPGQEMHWAREKSTDHADCIARHLIEHGTIDDDGLRHSAKLAWRSLALLQLEIEDGQEREKRIDQSGEYTVASEGPGCYTEGYTSKGDTRKVNPIGDVPMFNGFPIQYVPAEYFSSDVYPMFFIPLEWIQQETDNDPRLEANDAKTYAFRDKEITAYPPHRDRLYDKLGALGCISSVAVQILGGTRLQNSKQYVYIAGPMRGYPEFNFPAFDKARDEFLRNGWNVTSPADIDRVDGVTTGSETGDASSYDQRVFCYRDFYCLYLLAHLGYGAIAMLPGWENSVGAVAEFFLARWLGLKVLNAESGQPLEPSAVNGYQLMQSAYTFLKGQK